MREALLLENGLKISLVSKRQLGKGLRLRPETSEGERRMKAQPKAKALWRVCSWGRVWGIGEFGAWGLRLGGRNGNL